MDFYFGNPHPYPNIHQYHAHNSVVSMTPSSPEIALSDYLMLDDYVDEYWDKDEGFQSRSPLLITKYGSW